MNYLSKANIVVLGILVFLSSACLKKEEPVKIPPFKYAATSSCSLNVDNIQHIFKKSIEADIDCLEKTFENYIKIVRKTDERYVEHGELKKFMQHFYRETRQVPDEIFESAFGVISFFLGGSGHKFEAEKIKDLFRLIRFLNRNIPAIVRDVQSKNEVYSANRAEVKKRLELFVEQLGSVVNYEEGMESDTTLDMDELLNKLGVSVGLPEIKLNFFSTLGGAFKRMFVGGDDKKITLQEFVVLLKKLPQVVLVLKDYNYFNERKASLLPEQSDAMFYKFFNVFPRLLHQGFEKEQIVFTSEQLSLLVKYLYPHFEYEKLEPYIVFVKNKMFEGKQTDWSYGDVLYLFRWGQMIFGSSYFNHLTYQHYHAKRSFNILMGKEPPPLSAYQIFPERDVEQYWKNFKSVITSYRYFKNNYIGKLFKAQGRDGYKGGLKTFISIDVSDGEDNNMEQFDIVDQFLIQNKIPGASVTPLKKSIVTPQSDDFEKMVVEILNEVSVVKLIVSRLTSMYSKKGVLRKAELKRFLQEFESLLKFVFVIDLDITDSAVDNIFNQIDLLQFQSNGNDIADVEEITEFVTSLFFARRLAAEINLDLVQSCDAEYSERNNRYFFETNCYRERFIESFFHEKNYQAYFNGLLSDPVLMRSSEHYRNYFLNLENISQKSGSWDEGVMMDKAGLVRLMVSFFNIEGTCARSDRNKDGIIDSTELGGVYKIFKKFIRKKVASHLQGKSNKDQEKWAQNIFLYVIKNGELPDKTDLFIFRYFTRKAKDITTDRERISYILKVFLDPLSKEPRQSIKKNSSNFPARGRNKLRQ